MIHLCDGGDRIHVGDSSRLDTDERENKSEDKGKNGLPEVHVELGNEGGTADDRTEEKPDGPPGKRYSISDRGLGNDN